MMRLDRAAAAVSSGTDAYIVYNDVPAFVNPVEDYWIIRVIEVVLLQGLPVRRTDINAKLVYESIVEKFVLSRSLGSRDRRANGRYRYSQSDPTGQSHRPP